MTRRVFAAARSGDAGSTIPLVVLCFLVAGTFTAASIAASAAFLAQRDLAGICDGAAVAGATAVDRKSLEGQGVLPLDPVAVAATVDRYRAEVGRADLTMAAGTDGRTVTVTCRRTVHIPFGAVLGKADGLQRTAVARARSPLLPGN